MKNTQFEVEDVFGDVISKDSFSQELITKLNSFFNKNTVNTNTYIKFNFFKPKQKKMTIINRVLLQNNQIFDS